MWREKGKRIRKKSVVYFMHNLVRYVNWFMFYLRKLSVNSCKDEEGIFRLVFHNIYFDCSIQILFHKFKYLLTIRFPAS